MPFGAHESMETHEILMEKINCISHFNLYAQEVKNPQLMDMIVRHQQEEIRSYNEIVNYTHDYNGFSPIPPHTNIQGITPQQIRYGLHNPPEFAPQADARFYDGEIATAMLLCHKNGARNCSSAALECADPNLRMLMMNSAATCMNQAYEVFLFMNEQGLYQVPTLKDHTAKTLLHRYQPAGEALQAQYGVQDMGSGMGANGGYATNGNLNAGSANSVLYGEGGNGAQSYGAGAYGASGGAGFYNQSLRGGQPVYGGANTQGSMPQ
ncbi:MAG TPA: spore coat protein [Paenibacillus sp.]|uniref:spore coat protein n=1 Tax=Paenibacillus sp. TaxID=58172 RepID=UPI0028D221BE|nr:spore coat protein [Paenibacillus sp.]HUC94159.1 spore coat protein [Paenibacillus sp.]